MNDLVQTGQPAIQVKNLIKNYRVYKKPGDVLKEFVTMKQQHQKVPALYDVTFTVGKGEVVGVLGRNGAGKSTLLKVLTGVLDYDSGTIESHGKIAAILELGVGLNPTASGRENAIFGGICRGESRQAMEAKLPDIIAFSGLESVIDRPFKTYSSGMQARLLFATAIHVDSDILIIDEALAAGDALFQEKSNEKMKEIAASGRTVFFVSHSPAAVQQLCSRGLVLHEGRLVFDGDTEAASNKYHEILANARDNTKQVESGTSAEYVNVPDEQTASEMKAYFTDCELFDEDGAPVHVLTVGQRYRLTMTIKVNQPSDYLLVSANFRLASGFIVHSFHNALQDYPIEVHAGQTVKVHYDFICRCGGGDYIIALGLGERYEDRTPPVNTQIQAANSMGTFHVAQTEEFGGLCGMDGMMSHDIVDADEAVETVDVTVEPAE